MSVTPWPDHLLTLAEWDALPEDTSRRFELVEGVLQTAPRPVPVHQRAIKRLSRHLDDAWEPAGLETSLDVDVVLIEEFPPIVRAPDLIVTSTELLNTTPNRFHARDVILAIEVISPGSARTDRITKFAEYADVDIPYYWIVDLSHPVTLDAYQLIDGVFQQTVLAGTGTVSLITPAPLTLNLNDLV